MRQGKVMQAFNKGYSVLRARQRYRDRQRIVLLALLALCTLTIGLCAGDRWVAPWAWWDDTQRLFIWQLRLPRTLAVMLVGASLAMSGAVMQAIFDNPLAEPGLLGVANGAGVALVLCVFLGQGMLPVWALSLGAIVGALLMTFLLLQFARRHVSNARLLLIGVALGIVCSAVMTWAVYFSTSLDLRQLMYWMLGGFSGVDWRYGWLMVALVPFIIGLSRQGHILNRLSLGEIPARQLGISVYRWRNILVWVVGILVGISVALAGVIGFIGLIVPHALRLIGLTDQRHLLSGCALAGAMALSLSDTLARVMLPSAELPIGVITATFGAPLFVWLLLRKTSTSSMS